jgi:hypothetical protein
VSEDLRQQLPDVPRLCAIIDEVIAAWHAGEPGPGDWTAAERQLAAPANPAEPRWATLVRRLQAINTFQWHEEDRSRAHGAGDAVLGAVKRSIDASNRRRVQTIDALDGHLFAVTEAAAAPDPQATLHSETPGSIIDRLTVLALKRYHVAEALRTEDPGAAAAMQARLATVSEQLADLAGCLERLLADIAAGRVRLKLYRQVKVYRDEATGGLRADVS